MRKLMLKSLLTVSAVLTLAPATALALRPDCDGWCTASEHGIAFCSTLCTIPWSIQVITCGEWVAYYGYQYPDATCAPGVSAPEESSASEESAAAMTQDSEEGPEWVCRERSQAEHAEG